MSTNFVNSVSGVPNLADVIAIKPSTTNCIGGQIIFPSNSLITTKKLALDELNAKYFNSVESNDVNVNISNGKTYNLNKTLEKRIDNVTENLQNSEESNGFLGSTWSGFKNLTGIGAGSDKVRKQQEYEKELLQQFNTQEQRRPEIFKN